MAILLFLTLILWYGGFLLPVPCFVFACREWLRNRSNPPRAVWRRRITQIGLYLFVLALVFWIYTMVRNWTGHYVLYDGLIAKVGRLGSLSLFVILAFTQGKVRRYLLLGTLGFLLYFAVSIGEVAI